MTCMAPLFLASALFAQSQPFSSSSEYKSMLEELHRDPVRPSRMSAGILLEQAKPPADLKFSETPDFVRLETDKLRLEITKRNCEAALTVKENDQTWRLADPGLRWTRAGQTPERLRLEGVKHVERSGNGWRIEADVTGSSDPAVLDVAVVSPSVVRISVQPPHADRGARLEMTVTGAGPFFGLGERFDRVKLDGLKTELRPEDLLGQRPGHNWTYIPVPFLFTPRGLGMYLDTGEVSTFDLSRADEQKFSVQLDGSAVDAYFFAGEPKSIIEDYTALTGRTPLPPPWAFGVWICSYEGPQAVLDAARRLRKEGIPASAIWTFDVMGKGDIMGWPLWRTGYYPDPRQFTDQLHAMGFKALTYVHPYLRSVLDPYNLTNPAYAEGAQKGLMALDAEGKPAGPAFEPFTDGNIDFTSADNVNWWEQKVRAIVADDNFDGWMEDFGEWIKDTDRFAAGVSGRKMANLNPLFYHKITYEIAREAKPDFVAFDRSGYAGSQGYTRVIWGGDQFPNWSQDYGLPSVVRAGMTAGLSGFAVWGPDIAGNGFSKELWTRWVEFGALTPIMRNHVWDNPAGAVNLWHDAETVDTFRRYARLHVSLFPYLYSYARDAAKTGLPIMRHPMLGWPDDAKTYDAADEYLLGDKILVAPVIAEGATSRSVYLPRGPWVDYWTGKIIEGGEQVLVAAPLEHIPLLVRAGSIVPLISPDTETLAADLAGGHYRTLNGDLTWRIFPASSAVEDSFTLYDGTVARCSENSARVEVRVERSPAARRYEVIVPATREPQKVMLGGRVMEKMTAAHGNHGWRMNAGDGTLHVLFQAGDFDLSVDR